MGCPTLFNVSTRIFLSPHCARGGPGHLCKKHLFEVSLIFLFVGPTIGHFTTSRSLYPEGSNRVLFHVYFERVFCYRRWSERVLRMPRDAGCWQPKRRLPRAATSNRLRNLPSGPPSMPLSYKGKIVTQSDQSTYFVCILHPPSNPRIIL